VSAPGPGARVGVYGTFDLANYGDLLFPRIFELEVSSAFPSPTSGRMDGPHVDGIPSCRSLRHSRQFAAAVATRRGVWLPGLFDLVTYAHALPAVETDEDQATRAVGSACVIAT
jgi:hypothetical protein